MATTVFTDSRGMYLSDEIYNIFGEQVNVCYYRGTNIERLSKSIWRYTRSHFVDTAYIMVGVNDITTKDRHTGECFTLLTSPYELRDHLMDLYISLARYCYDECYVRHVIICTMTGISLRRYNRSLKPHYEHYGQHVINRGVRLLNDAIFAYNGAHGYHTPCLHHAVHLTQQKPYRHRDMYNRLRDGLHPTHKTLTKWATSLVHCMRLNSHL